jgi:hypothetical protein
VHAFKVNIFFGPEIVTNTGFSGAGCIRLANKSENGLNTLRHGEVRGVFTGHISMFSSKLKL